MAAIGDVDEANSAIGIALLHVRDTEHGAMLSRIQNELFDLGADIATPGEDFAPSEMTLRIVQPQIDRLEDEIEVLMAEAGGPASLEVNSFVSLLAPKGVPGSDEGFAWLSVNYAPIAMVVVLAMGLGLFAPPFGVGYYAACAIGKVNPAGRVSWHRVPNPNLVALTPTRNQVVGATRFNGGEGTWFDSGVVFFTTKGDNRVWAYDTERSRIEVLYDPDETVREELDAVRPELWLYAETSLPAILQAIGDTQPGLVVIDSPCTTIPSLLTLMGIVRFPKSKSPGV